MTKGKVGFGEIKALEIGPGGGIGACWVYIFWIQWNRDHPDSRFRVQFNPPHPNDSAVELEDGPKFTVRAGDLHPLEHMFDFPWAARVADMDSVTGFPGAQKGGFGQMSGD